MGCHWVLAWKLSDFSGALSAPEHAQDRSGGTLVGSWATLSPDAEPIRFRVDDEDDRFAGTFRETGDFAVLCDPLDLDGAIYPAGCTHVETVFQLQTEDIPSIELLVGKLGNGAHGTGRNRLVFSESQLQPGTTYEIVGCLASAPIRHDVICFAAGTMIDTPLGTVPVEELAPGSTVLTRDSGAKPVLWAGQRQLTANDLRIAPRLAPVRIGAGALGNGLPERDLVLSPQHHIARSLKTDHSTEASGEKGDGVLVPARALYNGRDVTIEAGRHGVTYYHLLLDTHQLVRANGVWAETLFTGPQAVSALCPDQLVEIESIHPGLLESPLPPILPILTVSESRAMGL